MIQIKEIVNSVFLSKTYILYREGEDRAWIVDIGDIEPVLAFLDDKGMSVAGVFITHAHFDHIYGLPKLVERFPMCIMYVTEYAKYGLASDKLNMSRYHEMPLTYEGENVVVVHEGESMTLFEGEPQMQFYETPGHNPGCLTMVVGDLIFSGDAFIPGTGIGVTCQLPHADKELALQSLKRIKKLAEGKSVLSGHWV